MINIFWMFKYFFSIEVFSNIVARHSTIRQDLRDPSPTVELFSNGDVHVKIRCDVGKRQSPGKRMSPMK